LDVSTTPSHADRYTYIPMVGLSWILAFGATDLLKRWPSLKPTVSIAAIAVCIVCVVLTRIQTGYWKDEVSLFQHAVEVTDNNFWVRHNLGTAHYTVATRLMDGKHDPEAIDHLQKALVLRPDLAEAHNNLGILLARTTGASKDAVTQFLAAVNLDPNLPQAHRNLGMLLVRSPESIDQGIAQLEIAQRLQPDPSCCTAH
jgi:tetratricopeptide (TPR) repeat protein